MAYHQNVYAMKMPVFLLNEGERDVAAGLLHFSFDWYLTCINKRVNLSSYKFKLYAVCKVRPSSRLQLSKYLCQHAFMCTERTLGGGCTADVDCSGDLVCDATMITCSEYSVFCFSRCACLKTFFICASHVFKFVLTISGRFTLLHKADRSA